MTKLPRGLSGKKVIRALIRTGFYIRRQRSSHVIMRRDKPFAQVVVPLHKSIDTGTLDAIIDGAGLTAERFIELL
ncbi:MAG: type II toxin-antitoxin system HicA family toxin [Candidatus Altiarchaeota archaeon]|nr:type II toxin-antitoxin system HicA family toxin [Candidatus Altiarchaeota archaeon]MBU4341227.1 type II toxin-antitoxin system HicA family toxin [Candidatus Altiarchaeota archaeon]